MHVHSINCRLYYVVNESYRSLDFVVVIFPPPSLNFVLPKTTYLRFDRSYSSERIRFCRVVLVRAVIT
ncbi:hypothetical protein L1987_17288 [Smallanthus sonchifolius]|uniref:Uncharacterized protein n=1 Tax=Smallanthus sonchifolius TaxID=185202 RepID=A0ACB9IZZ1_9ASTR|nr:hypothetical protein L1987_17288 [Smallanthus sonchifolius]